MSQFSDKLQAIAQLEDIATIHGEWQKFYLAYFALKDRAGLPITYNGQNTDKPLMWRIRDHLQHLAGWIDHNIVDDMEMAFLDGQIKAALAQQQFKSRTENRFSRESKQFFDGWQEMPYLEMLEAICQFIDFSLVGDIASFKERQVVDGFSFQVARDYIEYFTVLVFADGHFAIFYVEIDQSSLDIDREIQIIEPGKWYERDLRYDREFLSRVMPIDVCDRYFELYHQHQAERTIDRIELEERAELARLKAKYEGV